MIAALVAGVLGAAGTRSMGLPGLPSLVVGMVCAVVAYTIHQRWKREQ